MARNVHNYQHVKLLVVDDDCSIDNPRASTGRRGLAGIHLVSKIAGAMSAKGFPLSEIYESCDKLLSDRLIRTIGFSFHHDKSNELAGIEIGYGIHGEPGSIKLERERHFKPIIGIMMEKLRLSDVSLDVDVVILFNNLGGASEYVFHQFIGEFIELVSGLRLKIVKVYAGKFLTSLSKEALSVTVMEVNDPKIMEHLNLQVDVPSGNLFNCSFELRQPNVREFQIPEKAQRKSKSHQANSDEANAVKVILGKACEAVAGVKEQLNEMDGELGDGDTGSTLSRGADALLTRLNSDELNANDPHEMLISISTILMNAMGGTSGAIFSIFFQCASKAFQPADQHSVGNWIEALSQGIDGISRHGKSCVGDRTLLDSLQPGFDFLKSSASENPHKALKAFADGCRAGAESTKTMTPKSGRAAYSLSDQKVDFKFHSAYADPGAYAINVIADAISKAFSEIYSKANW